MSNFEDDFKRIVRFNNQCNTVYFQPDDSIVTYYAVLLNNGKIDTTTFSSGRIPLSDLVENQNFIPFKRITFKDGVVKLVVREFIPNDKIYDVNIELYNYIITSCDNQN